MRAEADAAPASRADTVGPALAIGAALVIIAGFGAAVWMMHPPYSHKWTLIDLEVYRAAGRALWHRESVYGPYVGAQLVVPLPFIYPPFAALLALPATASPAVVAAIAWSLGCVGLLAFIARQCFAPVVDRYGPTAWVLATLCLLALTPVQEHLRFGQVGIPLLAGVVADCLGPRRRLRGALTGLTTAVKLVPGIFIPYLAVTRRGRAAATALVTFALATSIGAAVAPDDSRRFWTDKVFEPTSPSFFSNQSLQGMLVRAIGPWRPVWIVTVLAVGAFGFVAGAVASRSGDERRGVALIALTAALVSPISWIHHLVWLIPALGVLAERVRTPRQAIGLTLLGLAFTARLPYLGHDVMAPGAAAAFMTDAYGLATLALLVTLSDVRGLARSLRRRKAAIAAGGSGPIVQYPPPPRSTEKAS